MTKGQQLISNSELAVLRCLGTKKPFSAPEIVKCEISKTIIGGISCSEIGEISFSTGIKDNDEVLRALYTLEGKRLVRPEPQGDFTSNQWQITDHGIKALEIMHSA